MAPILSKPPKTQPRGVQDALDVVERRARPLLDFLLDLVQATLESGGAFKAEVNEFLNVMRPMVDNTFKSSVRLLEAYCCLDLKNFARGRGPPLQGSLPILFVLMLIMMLYNAFVFAYMPAAGIQFSSATSLIFHAFIFLVLASFVQAVRTDPGGIPNTEEWRTFGSPPKSCSERKRDGSGARWCRKSDAYKPDRAHYCRVLSRSVLRMDHHCPWLGNTVGYANHKFFYLFLAYASTASTFLGISVVQLLVQATLPALNTFLLIGVEGLTLLLSTILVPFFFFHCWLLARNMTTIEFCEQMQKKEDAPVDSMYDMGLFHNISSVLGDNPLLWAFPVGGPGGDGINFPQRVMREQEPSVVKVQRHTHAAPLSTKAVSGSPGSTDASFLRSEFLDPEDVDPEAAHPAASSSKGTQSGEGMPLESVEESKEEEDEGDWDERGTSDEKEWWGGSESLEDSASAEGSASSAVVDSGGFLVWHSAAEFTDDLRVGCLYLGERTRDCCLVSERTLVDAAARFMSICSGSRGLCAPSRSTGRKSALSTSRRSSRSAKVVPVRRASVDAGSVWGGSTASGGAGGSVSDFFDAASD